MFCNSKKIKTNNILTNLRMLVCYVVNKKYKNKGIKKMNQFYFS